VLCCDISRAPEGAPQHFPHQTGHHHAARFFDSEREHIIDAVMSYPTASLFVEFEDGKMVSSRDYDASGGVQE
jgi:hypothetical protein